MEDCGGKNSLDAKCALFWNKEHQKENFSAQRL